MESDGKTENCTIMGPERRPGKTLLFSVDFAGWSECSTVLRTVTRDASSRNWQTISRATAKVVEPCNGVTAKIGVPCNGEGRRAV